MDNLIKISKEAVIRYFNTLSSLGYIKYTDVYKLIVLLFIEEFLSNYYMYITEEDYKEISKSLNCLYGINCMIEIPCYNNYDELIHNVNHKIPKVNA